MAPLSSQIPATRAGWRSTSITPRQTAGKRANGLRLRPQNHRSVAGRDEEPPDHCREGDPAEEPDDGPWLPELSTPTRSTTALKAIADARPSSTCQAARDDQITISAPGARPAPASAAGEHAVFR